MKKTFIILLFILLIAPNAIVFGGEIDYPIPHFDFQEVHTIL